MKKLILICLFSLQPLLAAQLEIVGPCSQKPILDTKWEEPASNVGAFTIEVLDYYGIKYVGSAEGLNSIQGTPTGMDAIEVISDNHMRAYGWCYEVDGRQPSKMPHHVRMQGKKHVKWFFAFSTYKDGRWRDYCTPSYSVKPDFLCN